MKEREGATQQEEEKIGKETREDERGGIKDR